LVPLSHHARGFTFADYVTSHLKGRKSFWSNQQLPLRGEDKGDLNMSNLKNFIKDEQGLETVEYAIITGLIVAGVIATIAAIGTWVKGKFENLQTGLGA
jgi:Flp pilus assembly pilin Flp